MEIGNGVMCSIPIFVSERSPIVRGFYFNNPLTASQPNQLAVLLIIYYENLCSIFS